MREVGDINAPLTSLRQTALSLACTAGALPLVSALLDAGADPGLPDRTGATCTSAACVAGHAHVLRRLLEVAGPSPALCDNNGLTPMHQAVGFGHPECLRCLLEHGADPNVRTGDVRGPHEEDGVPPRYETPLHISARLLTRAINGVDGSGSTEHQQQQRELIMATLVDFGADALATDGQGDTPLHFCARLGDAWGLWLLLGSTRDARAALRAANGDGTSVAEELAGAGLACRATALAASGAHRARLFMRKYRAIYGFIAAGPA